jgi:hypothetical protein
MIEDLDDYFLNGDSNVAEFIKKQISSNENSTRLQVF